MAVTASAIFEVRPTATLTGAGFFDFGVASPGTDYSQQDNPQYGFSDLATTNGTNAAPVVSSASHTFVAADVGNGLVITGGGSFTAGRYVIVSVSGGNATLDRACASIASTSGGTYKVGGAVLLGSSTTNLSDNNFFGMMVAGNKCYIQNGTYNLAVAVTASAASLNTPAQIIGYTTTRTDAPKAGTRPILNMGANIFTLGNFWSVSYCYFTGTGTSVLIPGNNSQIFYTRVVNTSTTAGRAALNHTSAALNTSYMWCQFNSYKGRAVNQSTSSDVSYFYQCYFHDSDQGLVNTGTTNSMMIHSCVFVGMVTSAIDITKTSGLTVIQNCTFYGSEAKQGTALNIGSGTGALRVLGNIFYGFTSGIVHADASALGNHYNFNNFYNNTTNRTNNSAGSDDTALDPQFTNVGQYTGTTATTSGFVLTDSGANFANVTDNVDFCYIVSGTGVVLGKSLIVGHTTTSLTLDQAPGNSAVADKVYRVTYGRNFEVGTNMRQVAAPTAFPGALFNSYVDMGALQRKEKLTTGVDATVLKIGSYTVNDASVTGTYDGSDRYTSLAEADVRYGTAYKQNSLTNNKTGLMDLPSVNDVRSTVVFDNGSKTGLLDLPNVSRVESGVTFDQGTKTGTFDPITAAKDEILTEVRKRLKTTSFIGLK